MATIDHTIPAAERGHEVFNQASPLPEMNLFDTDVALREALDRHGGGWGVDRVRDIGRVAGSAEAREHARRAELHAPVLKTHDRFGNRIDEVESDPSWHWLLRTAVEREVPSFAWRDPSPGSQVVRLAMAFLWAQVDSGVMCPLIMTFSSVPALQRYGGAKGAEWVERLTMPDYENGSLCGQAYTEKQAGSDLRQTTTTAEPLGDGSYEIWGHKWFCSAPMCDAFLTLAQTDNGLTCFLIERGEGFEIVRLKEKLGTRTLPSAEIELKGVRGWLVGEEGEGFDPLMRNLGHARLGPAAAPEMRAALIRAIHHCRGRSAFGRPLVEQPLMANVLASLAVQSEAATMTAMYLASTYEEFDSPLRRLLTSIMEYQGCGGVTPFVAEAMECFGGNGYGEDSEMPRLLRNASVHSISGTAHPPGRIKIGTVGRAAPGIELKLAEDGEILVRGGVVMEGYRNMPDETREAIGDGWLRTGDLGLLDDEGYLRIVGRKKEIIINAGGKNISPALVEAELKAASPLIGQALCVGDGRRYLTALIVLDAEYVAAWAAQEGIEATGTIELAGDARVRAAVAEAVEVANTALSRVEQIKSFTLLEQEWLPGGDELTPTMKLKRAPILAKYEAEIESMYE